MKPQRSVQASGIRLAKLAGICLFLTLTFAVVGCHGTLRSSKSAVRIKSLEPASGKPSPLSSLALQVMRFADTYATLSAEAADDFIAKATTPEDRVAGVKWKLVMATAAYVNATGPNPVLNVLDMIVLATGSRMVIEDYGVPKLGDNALPILETQRRLETDAWALADGLLKPAQRDELRSMINTWREQHPDQRSIATIRFRELAAAVGKAQQVASPPPNSVFTLLFLNPFSGLDPTASAIQETRDLAERAMYYSQRMPTLLNWQVQLLTLQLSGQSEIKQLFSNADKLASSAEAFAKVADGLPVLVNDQREAAIQQLLTGLASERTNLLATLEAQEAKVRSLLTETRETLKSGNEMAVSVQAAVASLDEFVRYVAPKTNQPPATVESRPFDVTDYGTAASRVGGAAKDLNELLTSLNENSPKWAQLRQETADQASALVNRAFWLGLLLIVVFFVGALCTAIAYRRLIG